MCLGRDCQNPKIYLISYNICKNQKVLTTHFGEITILIFLLIKLHVTEVLESLNEVCEGIAGEKNHTKKCCSP